MTDIRRMQLGQVVDFVMAYNERQKKSEKQSTKRRASQKDINAYFG